MLSAEKRLSKATEETNKALDILRTCHIPLSNMEKHLIGVQFQNLFLEGYKQGVEETKNLFTIKAFELKGGE